MGQLDTEDKLTLICVCKSWLPHHQFDVNYKCYYTIWYSVKLYFQRDKCPLKCLHWWIGQGVTRSRGRNKYTTTQQWEKSHLGTFFNGETANVTEKELFENEPTIRLCTHGCDRYALINLE